MLCGVSIAEVVFVGSYVGGDVDNPSKVVQRGDATGGTLGSLGKVASTPVQHRP